MNGSDIKGVIQMKDIDKCENKIFHVKYSSKCLIQVYKYSNIIIKKEFI